MRYLPDRPFPPYAFIPGKHPHPEKPGGHMENTEVSGEKLTSFKTNEAYLFAVDLYNSKYYWESHVWWEYLWHLENRKGETADFLKGLIKYAAGQIKEIMGQSDIAQGHFMRGRELLTPLGNQRHGLSLPTFIKNPSIIILSAT